MTAYERLCDTVHVTRDNGHGQAMARCPSHDDNHASLSITSIDGSVLVYCHAGCDVDDVLTAINWTKADLYDDRKGVTYYYPDGRRVHRSPNKNFRQSGNTKGDALFHAERIGDAETVYVVEGEKDVLAMESIGAFAVCNAMGAGKARQFDWSPLKGKHAIVVQDKDDDDEHGRNPGRKHAAEVAALLEPIAKTVQIVDAAVGKDAADHIAAGKGLDEFVHVPSPLLAGLKSAADLDGMTFDPLVEHVPSLIVEGFGILAGSPKVGKSWLAVAVALTCAQGGVALNSVRVKPRHVLLLALEDGDRRLQTRMRRLNADQPLPDRLDYLTKIPMGKVAATITAWLKLHRHDDNPPLIILDTLGKARPQRKPGEDAYIADYQLGTWIKDTVDSVPGAALLAIHHTRKTGAEDWLDTLSGTQGIAGSADYVLVLTRKRKSDEGLLAVTGRDIHENEYAMRVDDGLWRIDGSDLDIAAERAEKRREQEHLGDRALEVLAFVNRRVKTTAVDVKNELGIEQDPARVCLNRLAESGRIKKLGRGVYGPVTYVTTVTNDEGKEDNVTNVTNVTPLFDQGTDEKCRDCGGTPLWEGTPYCETCAAQRRSALSESLPNDGWCGMRPTARKYPRCVICGRGVVAGQTDADEHPAHLNCQLTGSQQPERTNP